MLEHVLPVGSAVAHATQELGQLRVQAMDPDLVGRLLARLDDGGLHLLPRLGDNLLDAPRMDAPIRDQPLEREPPHLAPLGVEAGHYDGVRSVIDDDVDPGRRLEGADVPPLAPDDSSLHLVGGERDGGHGGLSRVLGCHPLDRDGDDLLCLALGVLAGIHVHAPMNC